VGDEKSQYVMEISASTEYGLSALINPNGRLFHNASDFKGFSEKVNSDLSVSSVQGVEKAGVLVVICASSWSHRYSLQKASGIVENIGLE